MRSRLALITLLDEDGGGVPTPPIYYPPIAGQGPGFPTHPIAPGGPPPGVWPSPPGGIVSPPIFYPPTAGQGPGFPTNPIAPGGPPPGVWPGPGAPTHPIAPGGPPLGIWGPGSGFPTNPIAPGGPPPGVWPGPGAPTNPIVLPGGGYVLVFHPSYGWVLVPVGGAPTPPAPGTPDNTLPPTEPEPK